MDYISLALQDPLLCRALIHLISLCVKEDVITHKCGITYSSVCIQNFEFEKEVGIKIKCKQTSS